MSFTEPTKEQKANARASEPADELASRADAERTELSDEQVEGLSGGILTELAAALRQG